MKNDGTVISIISAVTESLKWENCSILCLSQKYHWSISNYLWLLNDVGLFHCYDNDLVMITVDGFKEVFGANVSVIFNNGL